MAEELIRRKAVVTGGASGIGAAIAKRFADDGAHVVVADLNEDAARSKADELGGEAWVVDLSDTAALEELRLDCDILVNCAGIQQVSPIEEFDPARFRLIHRIMLEAPFLLIRAALPHMYAGGWGRIINVSSVHGLVASPFKAAYVSAKHGLEGLSKVTALEGGAHGVTSVCINPGYVRTPLVEKQVADQMAVHGLSEAEVTEKVFLQMPAVKEFVEPADIAALASFLAGPHGHMASGASYVMDGGWTAR
ncbi:3-hydroxybutyrate dehydrogenase [Tessaracoccus sp. OS52]|uniref:3-hydroxybutyrate dehydrogenase n=1 Tax=Tessaracoccus sp. OS52 TaxID=2886691 RepID=UPI001D11402A|nr:3-hydroxybutyrate dehydrogenase [Tessaracoccus sp. OS52]MCC2594018.1 3-hydroxybutyrate dehydrogenase [Tessaracoccus sp. OS52]